jgi:hypothetical protein
MTVEIMHYGAQDYCNWIVAEKSIATSGIREVKALT